MSEENRLELHSGYYLRPRAFRSHKISTAPPHVREIYDWLLGEANHQDRMSSGKIIKRGQCFRTYADIQEGLAWDEGWKKCMYHKDQIETALKVLKRTGLVTTQRTTRGMIITLVNYDYYQDPKSYTNHTTNQSIDQYTNHTQTTHEPHDKQRIKSIEMNEMNNSSAPPPPEEVDGDSPQRPDFPERWQCFISYLFDKDQPLAAVLYNLESIEEGEVVTVFRGTPFIIRALEKDTKHLEKEASSYFGKPTSINYTVSKEKPKKPRALT